MVKSPNPPPPNSPWPFTGFSWMAVIVPSTMQAAAAARWAMGSFCNAIYAVEDDGQQSMLAATSTSPANRIPGMGNGLLYWLTLANDCVSWHSRRASQPAFSDKACIVPDGTLPRPHAGGLRFAGAIAV